MVLCLAVHKNTYSQILNLYPFFLEQMGDRLAQESNGNQKLLQDAQLCYIVAGSFDKLVSSWSGDAMKSTHDLQELVELVTFLQKAVERQGRTVEVSGQLADLLSHYASLLSSQGSLSTALNYLGTSQNEPIASLRERLYVSLGHKPAYAQPQQPRSRHPSTRQSFSAYPNPIAQPNQYNQPAPFNPPSQFTPSTPYNQANQPNYNQFNTGLPNATTNQPWSTQNAYNPMQPPKPFSPAPPSVPPTQPPRPTSVGSAHGGSGLPKSKYVLDPSVSSNPYGTRNTYGNNPMLPPMPNPNNFQSNPLTNPLPTNPYAPPALNPMPMNPMQSAPMVPTSAPNPTRLVPSMPQQPSFQNQFNQQNEPHEMGQSAMNILPSSAAPGWNDPPVLSKPLRSQVNFLNFKLVFYFY